MMTSKISAIGLALIGLVGCATTATTETTGRSDPGVGTMWAIADTPLDRSAARLDNATTEHLIWVDTLRDQIVGVDTARTVDQHRVCPAELLDAGADLPDLLLGVGPRVPRIRLERIQALIGDIEVPHGAPPP